MAKSRALPDLTTRFKVDYSDLTKAEKAAAKAHGEFQDGAKKSTTHTLRFQQSLTTLLDHFGGMPPIVNEAGRSIESMTSQGVSGMMMLGGAALIGLGAVAEGLHVAVDSYLKLAENVENYQRVTGESAQESSRQVQAMQMLGVSSDTASAAVYKLSKAIESTPKKLELVGIAIARTADGNVDLDKTLGNVADAYVAAGSAAQKNAILQAAFGRSGRDMIPVLEQGSAGLRELEQAVGIVFSQEDIDRAREYKIHVAEAQGAWAAFTASIGEKVVPALDAQVEAGNRANYVNQKMAESTEAAAATANHNSAAYRELALKFGEEFDAAQKATTAAQVHAQALQDEADAAAKLVKQEEDLITQLSGEFSASQKLDNANIALKESADKITEAQIRARDAARNVGTAQDAYNQAVRDYGAHSSQAAAALDALTAAQIAARTASDDVTKAVDDQYMAYLGAASAARDMQAAQDVATGGAKDAKKETEKYIDTLQAEADALAPNSPLRAHLQAYIDQLKSQVPSEVTTKYIIDYIPVGEGRSTGSLHYAAGGNPPVGRDVWVGEHGPERVRFHSAATVYPAGSPGPPDWGMQPGSAAAPVSTSRIEELLEQLVDAVTAVPSGQTGTEAALYKAMQNAGLNRARGHAGA